MKQDVIVVGAGPGGLASAILLAASGARVKVVERLGHVGGRTSRLTGHGAEGEAYHFDLGPTFFLYPKVLEEVFAAAGRDLREEVELIRLDPQYHLIFEQGGQVKATPDVRRMQQQIAALSPRDALHLPRYLEDNRRKLAAFTPILQRPFHGLRDVLDPSLAASLPLVRPWASVDRDLRRYFSDERVRLAFSFQSKYLGMSPYRCPSLFTILSFLEYEYGVFHPVGGCNALITAMAKVARDLGVDIRLNEPVTALKFDGRRGTGVATTSGEHRADAVVVNADFAAAMTKLVPDHLRRRWTDRNIAKKKFSCSTFMMYLGLDGEVDLSHHTIFLSRDYRQNLHDIETGHVLSQNPSFYVQNPCVTDDTLAPRGRSALYVLAPVTHEHPHVDWAAETQRFRARMIAQLGKLGVEDVERRIRFEKVLTPAGWRDEMNIYRGATFNLAHCFSQMLHLRPRNRFEDLEGVYLVGGGTHPGSGLPVIFESAKITSKLIEEDLSLRGRSPRRDASALLPRVPVPAPVMEVAR